MRRPVKIDHVELHRWVGLASLEMRHSSQQFMERVDLKCLVSIGMRAERPVLLPPTTRGQLLVASPCLPLGMDTVFLGGTSCR